MIKSRRLQFKKKEKKRGGQHLKKKKKKKGSNIGSCPQVPVIQACIGNQNPSINKKICIRFTYFMFYLVKVNKIFSYQYCKCDAANVDIVHIEVPLV